jgi:polyphosphate kinase
MAGVKDNQNSRSNINNINTNDINTNDINANDSTIEKNTVTSSTVKDSTVNHKDTLTQIGWQRSEDGSYSPSSYINRDLSLLQFHLRVLAQAASSRHPLL